MRASHLTLSHPPPLNGHSDTLLGARPRGEGRTPGSVSPPDLARVFFSGGIRHTGTRPTPLENGGLPVRHASSRARSAGWTAPSRAARFPLLLLLLVPVSCGGTDPACTAPCVPVASSPFGLWSEFLAPAAVRRQPPRLRRHGISLYQNIRSRDIGDPALGALFGEASCGGLEVRAWLTLPEEQGYWPNEKNAALFAEAAADLAEWIRSSGWPVDWIVVDMEPDLQTMETLLALLEAGDVMGAVELLANNHDPEAYARARSRFAAMVDSLHAGGFKVMAVTFPLVLDDLDDGDSTLQDVMNTPVDGIPWDEVSFMAYTSVFSRLLSTEIGPYLVYAYGEDAVRHYPDRAALDLGIFGHAGMTGGTGITDIEVFRAQVGAAKQAGLERVHAYSLDGFVEDMPDPDLWMDAFRSPAAPVPVQEAVDIFRFALRLLDRLVTDRSGPARFRCQGPRQ